MICRWCGGWAYTKCGLCGVPIHNNPKWVEHMGKQCFYEWHNEKRFGLAFSDCALVIGKDKKDWKLPTPQQIQENELHIEKFQQKVQYNLQGQAATVEDSS
jgi:hypothetical protein